jgi:hypothetical protein
MLKSLGVEIIPASSPDFFTEDTPRKNENERGGVLRTVCLRACPQQCLGKGNRIMAITDLLAIKIVTGGPRPLAEEMAKLYYESRSFVDFWNTNNGDVASALGGGRGLEDTARNEKRPQDRSS